MLGSIMYAYFISIYVQYSFPSDTSFYITVLFKNSPELHLLCNALAVKFSMKLVS